ncbi:MAG: DUF3810 domain-containing protein [Lachnospiraceae bacterium]|nr:DUF3810 domain-containing protein [Lachnospiraceae bacterium]
MKELFKEKKNFLLLAYPLSLILVILARCVPGFAEYVWARGAYRAFRFVVASITGLLTFSLAEIIVILILPALVFFLVRAIIRAVRAHKEKKAFLTLMRTLRNFLMAVGFIWLVFTVGAGINYSRDGIGTALGLEVGENNVADLKEVCIQLASKASAARTELEDMRIGTWFEESGYGTEYKKVPLEDYEDTIRTVPFESMYTNRERAEAAREAMKKLSDDVDVLWGAFPPPKSVAASQVMSMFDISGVFFPWTIEANVNVDTPDHTKGFVACHELSHVAGFMREDEANFIAYLACRQSGDAELKYSGYIFTFVMAYNKLYEFSKEACSEVSTLISPGMRADMIRNSEYWDRFREGVLYEAGSNMNNTYLKINGQKDGTGSYGRMLDLVMALYRKDGEV